VINIIHSLNAKVVGADIVELNPGKDPLGITAMTAAKIVKEIAGACIKSLSST
jgi:arginase family enzyme